MTVDLPHDAIRLSSGDTRSVYPNCISFRGAAFLHTMYADVDFYVSSKRWARLLLTSHLQIPVPWLGYVAGLTPESLISAIVIDCKGSVHGILWGQYWR